MKTIKRWLIVGFSALLLVLAFYPAAHSMAAEDAPLIDASVAPVEAVAKSSMTEDEVTDYLAKQEGISLAKARAKLFNSAPVGRTAQGPTVFSRSASTSPSTYAVVQVSLANSYRTLSADVKSKKGHAAGFVYFYCTTSESGLFRGIKKINYAGYSAGKYNFVGKMNYMLIDPNIIHYTLNGAIHNHASVTVSGGVSIGVGEGASINIGISTTTSFVDSLFVDTNYTF